jgi:hypothetical protein
LTIDFQGSARPLPAGEPMLKKDNLLSADQTHQSDTTENIRHRTDALFLCPTCLGAWPVVVGDLRRFMIGQVAVLVTAIVCLMIWIVIGFWKNIDEIFGLIQ